MYICTCMCICITLYTTIHCWCTCTHCTFSTCIYVCVYASHSLPYIVDVHVHTVPFVHVYNVYVCVYVSHCTLPYIVDVHIHTVPLVHVYMYVYLVYLSIVQQLFWQWSITVKTTVELCSVEIKLLNNYCTVWWLSMAHKAIPMIAFPRVRCMFIYMYIYIYMFVSIMWVCIVYIVKEVTLFRGAR